MTYLIKLEGRRSLISPSRFFLVKAFTKKRAKKKLFRAIGLTKYDFVIVYIRKINKKEVKSYYERNSCNQL